MKKYIFLFLLFFMLSPVQNFGQYLNWAFLVGPTQSSALVKSIAKDDQNNIYAIGYFYGTADFDPDTSQTFNMTATSSDIFVSKYNHLGLIIFLLQTVIIFFLLNTIQMVITNGRFK